MSEGEYTFAGITEAEPRERIDENVTSGVPAMGSGQVLLYANVDTRRSVNRVHARNSSPVAVLLRLRHGVTAKTQTNEALVALNVTGSQYLGRLSRRSIVAGSVSITNAGAPLTIVDNGSGVLHDTAVPASVRGTINYVTGDINFTYGASPTKPVRITYNYTDPTDFVTANQTSTAAALGGGAGTGGVAHALQTGFGRVVPHSVSIADGTNPTPLTFVDDGKGNIIQFSTTSSVRKAGTIDYATGAIVISTATAALDDADNAIAITYQFNPFAGVLAAGGANKLFDLFSGQIPELTAQPWGAGMQGESQLALWGESRNASQGAHISTAWGHFGEEIRVEAPYSEAPVGGYDNNPPIF